MSDANLTRLLYVKETAFGVIPSGPPKLTEIRFLSSGLTHEKLTVMSDEIRHDRARTELIQVGKNAQGPVETELIVGGYDDFILAALLAEEWTIDAEAVAGTIAAAGNTFTRTSGTFSATLRGAKFVHISGAANATNNGIKRVVSWTTTVLTVDDFTIDESATIEITVKYARGGVFLDSFTIEQQYLSLDPVVCVQLLGLVINQWSLNMQAQDRVLQTFDFLGTKALSGSTAGDGAPTESTDRFICNTTGNIGSLIWNGSAFQSDVLNFTMALNNNLRNRPAIGRETTKKHGKGRSEPNGSINAYFESTDLLEAFINHDSASLVMPITDPDGNLLSIFLPHLQFPTGFPTIPGVNSDVMVALEYNATIDTTLGFVIQVDRLDVQNGS